MMVQTLVAGQQLHAFAVSLEIKLQKEQNWMYQAMMERLVSAHYAGGSVALRLMHQMPLANTGSSLLRLQFRLHWANSPVQTQRGPMSLQASHFTIG